MFNSYDYLERVQEFFKLKNFAPKTEENYLSSISLYLRWLQANNLMPEEATYEDIRKFLMQMRAQRKWTHQTTNFYISKIKFFQLYVLNKEWNSFQVPFAKYDTKQPEILTKEEIIFFIDTLPHLKTKAICALMYGSGLRVTEARSLKYEDISRSSKTIYIRKSKSRCARYSILPDTTLEILTKYWRTYNRPKDWLFPNRSQLHPIDTAAIDYQIKLHAKRLNWKKNITPHMFRHSFATHLFDDGVDLLIIQKLMGHKSIQSTKIYIHLSEITKLNILSPIDGELS